MRHRARALALALTAFAAALAGYAALLIWQPAAAVFLGAVAYGVCSWIVRRRRGLTLLALAAIAWHAARHYRRRNGDDPK